MINFDKQGGLEGDQELSQEEMKQNLTSAADSVQGKYRDLNSSNVMNSQRGEIQKKDLLNKLFDLLEQYDIDPSDQEQLAEFVKQLKALNPDVYKLFERAIGDVLSGEGMPGVEGEPMAPEEAPVDMAMSAEGMPGGEPMAPPVAPPVAPQMPPQMPPQMGQGGKSKLGQATRTAIKGMERG